MPGFINNHTHLSMVKGIADDLNLDEWLKTTFGHWKLNMLIKRVC